MGGNMAEPKLLDQYRERLRVKHYSLRTEDTYLHWARRFIYFRHSGELRNPLHSIAWTPACAGVTILVRASLEMP